MKHTLTRAGDVLYHTPGCLKCGQDVVTVAYWEPTTPASALQAKQHDDVLRHGRRSRDERMNVTCATCGFLWTEPTQDAAQS